MFVGHGLVAFAAVAALARRRGAAPERALRLGVLAGLFATLPDVDVLFALSGLAGLAAGPAGVDAAHDAFWSAAHEFHRAVTHSLPVGGVVALAAAAWRGRQDRPWLGAAALLAGGVLLGGAWLADGPVAAAMLAPVVVGALALSVLAGRLGVGPRALLGAAAVGLLSHPFGDLLAGEPPAFLYPLELPLLTSRLVVHPDPTLNLLAAFFVELATVWAALVVFVSLRGYELPGLIRPRAALGLGYAGAVVAVPAPTVETSYQFVFSVLAVGVVGLPARPRRGQFLEVAATALAAVTLAALAYTGAYLLV